jgi:hypothetical protein
MSNIEMQAANAILAIDSLDRYILAGGIETTGVLGVSWLVATPNIITLDGAGQVGVLGATLTLALPPAAGWPVGVVVTIIGVVGNQITIDANVTANSGPIEYLFQTFSLNTGTTPAQPRTNALIGNFNRDPPNCNDFIISSPGALIYGYIDRIVVSQIQIQYNIPTVCFRRNDFFFMAWISPGGGGGSGQFLIPFGFYTPDELASMLSARIVATPAFAPVGLTVQFDTEAGFIFQSTNNYRIYVPEPGVLLSGGYALNDVTNILKTYKMLGLTKQNGIRNPVTSTPTIQLSSHYPNFLYTPYIDIYSDVLTNYQNVKDNNTSIAKPKGLVARVLLSGAGNPQLSTDTSALGSAPFVMTADLNNPKVIKWSPDVAVPSIDFQVRDCYGDLIPGVTEQYPTEFQMTLMCIEG